uniref:Spermatosis associated 24 n=1 Tax=Latimeria chalumnae TaxID=7897 RepID=H3ANN7_LATCH
IIYKQLQEIIAIQEEAVSQLQSKVRRKEEESISREEYEDLMMKLEDEKLEHAKTKSLLTKESEKLQFALGEIEILTKQLEREKLAFEKALASIKNKTLKESTKNDKLKSKCNEIESQIVKQKDLLDGKENKIKELHHVVRKQKQTLK